jgi:hypothetical protein
MLNFDEPECEPSRSGNTTCFIFWWIGQGFDSCENCGKPHWEHLFDPAYGGSKGTYRVKEYVGYKGTWRWKRVNPITAEGRERTRERWEGYTARATELARRV